MVVIIPAEALSAFFLYFTGMDFRRSVISLSVLFATAFCAASPAHSRSGENGYFQIGTDFDIGLNGGPTDPDFAVDTADWYGNNWRGLQIPLENARSYEEHLDPFFTLSFRAGYKNFHVLLEAPLRRDLEA